MKIFNSDTERYEIKPSMYNLRMGDKIIANDQKLELGAVYTMIINRDQSENYVSSFLFFKNLTVENNHNYLSSKYKFSTFTYFFFKRITEIKHHPYNTTQFSAYALAFTAIHNYHNGRSYVFNYRIRIFIHPSPD